MNPYKSKKGLSAVVIIIIILVIGALGAGGYFGYTMYLEPMMNPYSKLIPSELKPYAMGKNAEAFLVVKNDEELKEVIFKSSPQSAEQVNNFEAALVVANTTRLSGAIVMLFSTADKAAELKTLGESQVQSGPVTFTFQQKDKVLIASFGGGLDAMGGPLLENPAIKKLDQTMLDSQLIAYAATSQMGTLGDTIGSMFMGGLTAPSSTTSFESSVFPSAHAQAFETTPPSPFSSSGSSSPIMTLLSAATLVPFINDTTVYARYKNSLFDIRADITFLEKSALAGAPLLKNSILKDEKMQIGDLEKTYDAIFATVQPMTAELQKYLDEQMKAFPGSTAKLSYDSLKLSLAINFPSEIAEKQVQGLLAANMSAPAKGRDAARKANLNMLVTAIEAYNLDKGNYPMPSACLENMEKQLSSYIVNGKTPAEVKGYELKMDNCESNYFYQYFGDKGYVLWAKMDLPADGNISITPVDFEKAATAGNVPASETSGTYYMLNKSYFSMSGATKTTTATIYKEPAFGSDDITRKKDLTSYLDAITEYSIDSRGNLPKDSACVEDLTSDINKYFPGSNPPADPDGSKSFGFPHPCSNGYYYQSLGNNGFALWAKMDNPANGNTWENPGSYAKQSAANTIPKVESSGSYYIKTTDRSLPAQQSAPQQTQPVKKIKRTP